MKAGETGYIKVAIPDLTLSAVDEIIFTLKSANNTVTKTYPTDVTLDGNTFLVPLTQANTIALNGFYQIEAQINFTDNSVSKSVTQRKYMSDTLATDLVTGNEPSEEQVNEITLTTSEIQIVSTGGTSDYDDLDNRPKIEGVTLSGNKTASDLGLAKSSDIPDVSGLASKAYVDGEIDSLDERTTDIENSLGMGEKSITFTVRKKRRYDTNTGEVVETSTKYGMTNKMECLNGCHVKFNATNLGIRVFSWLNGVMTVSPWTTSYDNDIECDHIGINLAVYNGSYGQVELTQDNLDYFVENLSVTEKGTLKSKSIKILGIGNSYTRDCLRWLWGILHDCGYEPIVGHGYIGGITLQEQYSAATDGNDSNHSAFEYWKYDNINATKTQNQTLETIIKDEKWDIVVFQQQSDEAGQYNSFVNSDFDISDFVAYVMNLIGNSTLRIGINATWSHPNSYTGDKFISYYGGNGETQYNAIQSVIPQVANHIGNVSFIVNTGKAVKLARQNTYLGAIGTEMTRDLNHLAYGIPQYMCAVSYANAILGITDKDITFFPTSEYSSDITTATSDYLAFLAKKYAIQGNDL